MSYAIWLSRDEGLRAVAAAKSKYQRDLVMGTIAWGDAPVGTRGRTALDSYGASRRSLRETLRRLRIDTSLHLIGTFASTPPLYEGETLDEAAVRGRGTTGIPRGLAETIVIGSISPGFVDDAERNGRRLAASLVLACAGPGGRGSTEPPDELTEWFREQRDVEEMFAAIDGHPRYIEPEPMPQAEARGDEWRHCVYCGNVIPDDEKAPEVNDDAAWATISGRHAANCEWVRTRAGARPDTREEWRYEP